MSADMARMTAACTSGAPPGAIVRHEEEAPAREAERAQERIACRDDPGILAAERGEQSHRVGKPWVICHDEQWSSRRYVLAPFDGKASGRFVDDPRRAVPQP